MTGARVPAIGIATVLAASLCLWLARRYLAPDWAAFAGALVIALAEILAFTAYVLLVLDPGDDIHVITRHMLSLIRGRFGYWALLIGGPGVIGLWIGGTAREPLSVGVVCFLVFEAFSFLNDTLPPRLPMQTVRGVQRAERILARGLALLIGCLIGSGVQLWFFR